MSFRIRPLPLARFKTLFQMDAAALLELGARRMVADGSERLRQMPSHRRQNGLSDPASEAPVAESSPGRGEGGSPTGSKAAISACRSGSSTICAATSRGS